MECLLYSIYTVVRCPLPPYLLQYNLVITLTTLLQLPSVEFFKTRLISQLTVSARLELSYSHHMSSVLTNKNIAVPGQLSSVQPQTEILLRTNCRANRRLGLETIGLWSRWVERRHKD